MAQKPQIIAGPNKYDLMLALFDRTSTHPRPITFSIQNGSSQSTHRTGVSIHVESVSIEDGSGESWIVTGEDRDHGMRVKLHYSTKTRSGMLLDTTKT